MEISGHGLRWQRADAIDVGEFFGFVGIEFVAQTFVSGGASGVFSYAIFTLFKGRLELE